jgi:AraC family transcriptional regulator, transcriptional activator FtrA
MHVVALAITDGTPLFELAAPTAVFGVPEPSSARSWYDLRLCASPGAVVGGAFRAETPHDLETLASADTVVVPACHDSALRPPAELIEALNVAHAAGARVASICTGAFALAAAGLLDGRRATTHWMHAPRLADRHPRVAVDPGVLYVDEGDVLTSAGKSAGMDLCLHIVARDHGAAVANAVARRLVVPPHRAGGQAQFIHAPVPADGDHRLAQTMAWALDHLDQPLTVNDLAEHAHLSTRSLTRHFSAISGTTPLQWLLHQRVLRAQELLEHTDDTVETIAMHVGMGSAATLRRHFTRVTRTSPTGFRQHFRAITTPAIELREPTVR